MEERGGRGEGGGREGGGRGGSEERSERILFSLEVFL